MKFPTNTHLLCGFALAAILIIPTDANARSQNMRGKVTGDANARVFMKVKFRGDEPVKIKRFRFIKLDHACTDLMTRELSGLYRGRLRILNIRGNRYRFFGAKNTASGLPAPNTLFVTAKLKRSARKITGEMANSYRFPSALASGETACTSGPGPAGGNGTVKFVARRR